MSKQSLQTTFDQALQHHQAGRLGEAEQLYRQIIEKEPNHADALHFLGLAAAQVGRNDVAADLIGKAIAVRPNYPEALSNLGNVLKNDGRLDAAIAAYRRAISFKPYFPEAYSNLGSALNNKGQHDEAIAAYRTALTLNPRNPQAHYNLGNTLKDKKQLDPAIASYRQAIALHPNYPEAHYNLGTALSEKGQVSEAIAAYRQAIASRPNYAEAHWNLALMLLARGDFQEGFKEHQWRWECKALPQKRNFPQPQWDGGPLQGRTILLHAEQGYGDTLQFIRYAPLVAARGATVIIGSVPELHRLLQTATGVTRCIASGETLPPFDTHCPMMSLPWAMGTTLQTIPNAVPYLHADPADVSRWHAELSADPNRFKVGLSWAGNPTHVNDRNRSLSLAALAPLAQVPGVSFYSLQKGEPAGQPRPPGFELIDRTESLHDFADTAALIANLDLVISVDTAVVHLAGAMGKPVWTLLPFTTDWRWLLEREDSPWYPSMRLFRQTSVGDWDSVIRRVGEELSMTVS